MIKAAKDEAAFLREYDPGQFERPAVATDVVLLSAVDGALHTLLLHRDQYPDLGKWALPGGFVGMEEGIDAAARRVLKTKAGLEDFYIEQLATFGEPTRDPRMRVISISYYALVEHRRLEQALRMVEALRLGRISVPWEGELGGPVEVTDLQGAPVAMAFDHAEIIGTAVKRMRGKLNYAPVGYPLLPEMFTLRDLQAVHETILGRPVNKDSFRRRMLASGELKGSGQKEGAAGHRPAELYRFQRNSSR